MAGEVRRRRRRGLTTDAVSNLAVADSRVWTASSPFKRHKSNANDESPENLMLTLGAIRQNLEHAPPVFELATGEETIGSDVNESPTLPEVAITMPACEPTAVDMKIDTDEILGDREVGVRAYGDLAIMTDRHEEGKDGVGAGGTGVDDGREERVGNRRLHSGIGCEGAVKKHRSMAGELQGLAQASLGVVPPRPAAVVENQGKGDRDESCSNSNCMNDGTFGIAEAKDPIESMLAGPSPSTVVEQNGAAMRRGNDDVQERRLLECGHGPLPQPASDTVGSFRWKALRRGARHGIAFAYQLPCKRYYPPSPAIPRVALATLSLSEQPDGGDGSPVDGK